MQLRLLLLALVATSVALAGCAENDGATPPKAVSNEEAESLFASAAGSVPDRYGMEMEATNATTTLMSASAVYDEPAQTAYFRMEMDPALFEDMGEGMSMGGGDAEAFRSMSVYMSPQGNAFLVNGTVMLTEAEEGQFDQATGGQEGFDALSDPEAFIGELRENDFTVTKVTPTTLRGKGALMLDATVTEEGESTNLTIWLFQDPTRVARIEGYMPPEQDDESPFGDATMAIDLLYDDEVTLAVPDELVRALGLRYESSASSFSFGGDGDAPETWTFQVDGGIPLGDVQAEVGSYDDEEGDAPDWTMLLTAGSKTQDGLTLTFSDVDADGKVSQGDTLVIERGDDGFGAMVALRDNVTGLRIVPGAGLLLAALAIAAACGVTRRK